MIREFDAESSSQQTASSAKRSATFRILRRSARNPRVRAGLRQSKGPGESRIAGVVATVAAFLSARRPLGALCADVKTISASEHARVEYQRFYTARVRRRYGFAPS